MPGSINWKPLGEGPCVTFLSYDFYLESSLISSFPLLNIESIKKNFFSIPKLQKCYRLETFVSN